MTMDKTFDFLRMSTAEALDILADLDARAWGEHERNASRKLNAAKSRGLLINSIVYHRLNDYGDIFDSATKQIAEKQLTDDDWRELHKGG